MTRYFLLLITLLFCYSCGNESEQKKIEEFSGQKSVTPEKANPAKVKAFFDKLPEVHLPLKISIGQIENSHLIPLRGQQLKDIFPESESDSSETKIFAIARISVGDGHGIFLYTISPNTETDESEPKEIIRIQILLYTSSFEESDILEMAVQDYSSGWTLFKSVDDITFYREAEMEFINLEITKYRLKGNKFGETSKEIKEFSGEKYYEKYETYVRKIENGISNLQQMTP